MFVNTYVCSGTRKFISNVAAPCKCNMSYLVRYHCQHSPFLFNSQNCLLYIYTKATDMQKNRSSRFQVPVFFPYQARVSILLYTSSTESARLLCTIVNQSITVRGDPFKPQSHPPSNPQPLQLHSPSHHLQHALLASS